MFLKFVFTSFIIQSLCFLSKGEIEANQTSTLSATSTLIAIKKSDLAAIRENQQEIKVDQLVMKSNIGKIISAQERIKEELTLLKTGQTKLETLLNHLIENFKPINDALKEATKKDPKPSIGRSCAEATFTTRSSGVYDILIPSYSDQSFKVACNADIGCGNWTVILQRKDGSVDFYRDWAEYKAGFGNLTGEFFLGLDKIHAITNDQPQELLIRLEDFDGEVRYESYDAFAIGDESELYRLNTVGKASGNAGDSFSFHHGLPFSSRDRDNDMGAGNCAVDYHGGWWFKECHKSHLMGTYHNDKHGMGVNWLAWHGYKYSLKGASMMIRPKKV